MDHKIEYNAMNVLISSVQFLEMSTVQNIAKQSLGNLSINCLDVL